VWVKICGITRREDALAAAALGADAVGFVFTAGPRRVLVHDIAGWVHEVRGVEKVGVFRGEPVGEIMRVCSALGLDTVQLHVRPDPSHVLLAERYGVIYAVRDHAAMEHVGFTCRILVDGSEGTGRRGRWVALGMPYILAGGLTPENVRRAIELARPSGVDVSSGVETASGIKDHDRMRLFIREARS